MKSETGELSGDAGISVEEKVERLEKENKKLKKKIQRLKKSMEITSKHGDTVAGELEEKVEASIREIEERVRLISETLPVPLNISRMSDGKIVYVNEHACRVFGLSEHEFTKYKAGDLFESIGDHKNFLDRLAEKSQVNDFEVRMKKKDGALLWATLFSKIMEFKSQPCVLTVVYDLTERKEAEEEIRRLNEALERDREREGKYLIFSLADEEYGVNILKVREIIGLPPLTPVPQAPEKVKGVVNLRGRIIPVVDLGIELGTGACENTDRTSVIIIETEGENGNDNKTIGMIVDYVVEVLNIKGKHIGDPPPMMLEQDTGYLSGMAKTAAGLKIILDVDRLFAGNDFNPSAPKAPMPDDV